MLALLTNKGQQDLIFQKTDIPSYFLYELSAAC